MPKGVLNVPGPSRYAPLAERFWSRVKKTPGEGCWLWLGSTWIEGYGRIIDQGKQLRAHRVAWELIVGPIPMGMQVLHACDNPPCVRVGPGHLFLGKDAENSADKVIKERHVFGVRVNTAKLYPEQVITIRDLHSQGVSIRKLSRMFGIQPPSIKAIIVRTHWKSVL